MAKKLTDKEMAEIVHKAVHDERVIECQDFYQHFLEDLAGLICTYFGGERLTVSEPYCDPDMYIDDWSVAFRINELVPNDGGVFQKYDRNVSWRDGVESHPNGGSKK